jgi:hypothetical protein
METRWQHRFVSPNDKEPFMSSSYDEYGNQKDSSGKPFQTPDNKPPQSGTPITIYENGQAKPGTWIGGVATENKG